MRMTIDEIRLITFVVLALLVGALAKNHRATHPQVPVSAPPAKSATGTPSSSH